MLGFTLAVHAMSTLAMVGVIWFVQLVHYPLMGHVGRSQFAVYEREHQRRTTWLVAPLMLAEAVTAALLLLWPTTISPWLAWTGAAMLIVLWLSTFLWQVPCHTRLAEMFDSQTHHRLVQSNWLRTALWSVRGVLAIAVLSSTSLS